MSDSSYEVELFREQGFKRRSCPKCNRSYWSLTERVDCGEPPCSEYSFIGDPPTKKSIELNEMREKYLSFFEKNNHVRINRYPVVARWRDDIFFSIASISCFQPWVLNGTVEPPANPLTMSQTSLRFNDIDNVGKTGRHFTEFEMMAHHAFNTKGNYIYFKDKTVELCHKLLLELGIKPEEIIYLEDEWSGGGNSGPCFEVIVRGVELATLVFMMYEDTPSGKKEMDMQVVDTGYGLERFAWVSQGTSNAYEAVLPAVLGKLKKEVEIKTDEQILAEYSKIAGMMNVESSADINEVRKKVAERIGHPIEKINTVMEPYENLYAIGDHTRALTFMLNDGVVPSNVKDGYFARLLVRRTLRSLRALKLEMPLHEIIKWQIKDLGRYFTELKKNRDDILKLAEVEEKKYLNTVEKGSSIVKRFDEELRKEGRDKLSTDNLIHFYDSHGLVPELVAEFTQHKVIIPEDFYIKVAEIHTKPEQEKEEERVEIPSGLDATKLAFYEDEKRKEFTAEVKKIFNDNVVLDNTCFYPEGGGQETDYGTINDIEVVSVQKAGNVVVHRVKNAGKLKEGDKVSCKINWDRRIQLMKHHTATHIINGAAKRVLGNHVWQAGAHKSEDLSRLDITHYASLTDEEIRRIEELANKVVQEDRPIKKQFMNRNDAEKKYGFTIYQGGAVPGKELRIVDIEGWDVEACGGTHFDRTGELDSIKIIRSKRIQDGVVRLEYKAGTALDRHVKEVREIACEIDYGHLSEDQLKEIASIFSVQVSNLPATLERFREEWNKNLDKIIDLEKRAGRQGLYSKKYREESCGDPMKDSVNLFNEWKTQRKEIGKLQDELRKKTREEIAEKYRSDYSEADGVKVVKELTYDLDVKNLNEIANNVLEKNSLLILGNIIGDKANVLVASDSKYDAVEVAQKICRMLGGNASGNQKTAVGGGSSTNLKELITKFNIK